MKAWRSKLNGSLSSFIPHPSSFHFTAHLCVCVSVVLVWSSPARISPSNADTPARRRASVEEVDAALQRAATLALGGREGTIIVMDAQTGRLRAVVNENLATDAAFPPGSAVKPFTLLAALRARLVSADTRLLCRKHYRRGGVEFSCSHPVFKTLFDPAHALAHSCNYFFAHLGERLDADTFDSTLSPFGFGATEPTNDKARAANALPPATNGARASSSRLAHGATSRTPRSVETLSPRLPQRGEWRTADA
ncbi:MAG: penicillin-binding transpeptidase domain-containing protein, partial [Pyrinomonadaceae bacterium]